MSGNGRLAVPGQMNVATTYADGPLAQPSSVPLQTQGGLQILVLGGLTKVEALAGLVVDHNYMDSDSQAKHAADLSEAILAECARRRTEATKETP